MTEEEIETDVIKLKADYETAISDNAKLKEEIENLKAEQAKLNRYIANYVSSPKPADSSKDMEPKSFNEFYNETISKMMAKKD